jgi:glycosyltransferase involved in cell wall biosynthesis
MKIACLMPTYGRRPELLNNSIACFLDQVYENKVLVIVDDLGNLKDCKIDAPNIFILSSNTRCSSVGFKYNLAINFLNEEYDAISVWDDDDIYLPEYLSYHAEILKNNEWSKPSKIITAYTDPLSIENASGRFHGTLAIGKKLLIEVDYWENTRIGTFDQEFIAKLQRKCNPGDPCLIGQPKYVYRWQTSQSFHSSGMIHKKDYFKYKPQYREVINTLIAEYDQDTKNSISYILENLN